MSATTESNRTQKRMESAAGKHLTFSVGAEFYGMAVLNVREILKLVKITAVPQMPAHVKGGVNLRGKIIPVVDLRVKLGMDEAAGTDRACIDGLA